MEAAFVGSAYTTTAVLEVNSEMVEGGVVSFDIDLQVVAILVADTLAMVEARFGHIAVVARIPAIIVVDWPIITQSLDSATRPLKSWDHSR